MYLCIHTHIPEINCIYNMYYFIYISINILLSYIRVITTYHSVYYFQVSAYIYVCMYIHTYTIISIYSIIYRYRIYIYSASPIFVCTQILLFPSLLVKKWWNPLTSTTKTLLSLFCRPDWNFFLPWPICLLLHLFPLRYCHFFFKFQGFIDRDI